jgi:hypothetical protein
LSGKIIVTGTPRSGTTFVMSIFHSMGVDIGFSDRVVRHLSTESSSGGLEFLRTKDTRKVFRREMAKGNDVSPMVIKHPIARPVTLENFFGEIKTFGWKIDMVILMSREFSQVISSTIYHRKIKRTLPDYDTGGDTWEEVRHTWEERLPMAMALLSRELVNYPTLVVYHPLFAENMAYAREVFVPVLSLVNRTDSEFKRAWVEMNRPSRIIYHE